MSAPVCSLKLVIECGRVPEADGRPGDRLMCSRTTMNFQAKKSFAIVLYDRCAPKTCNPEKGVCASVAACSRKVIKQIDGAYEPPIIFQDMCMGCWDCIEACPLTAVEVRHTL